MADEPAEAAVVISSAGGSDVARAMDHCRALTRRHARNFYYGLRLAPEPQRSALYAVYAWMRRADALADADPARDGEDAAARVEAFRVETDAALAGAPTDDPVLVALAHTARRFPLRRELLHDMLRGQLDDLAGRRYETFEALREYCYRVASTVGLVCIDVWGYEGSEARHLAIERGIAFQLTNILRDYAEDYDQGRVYLPRAELEAAGVTPEALRRWADPAACRAAVAEQAARARRHYAASAPLDELVTPACRPTLWAMTSIYRGLLAKIEADPASVVGPRRIRLSSWRKTCIAMEASLRARRARRGASGRTAPA